MDLEPCPSCRRHVRIDEATCPFCAAAVPAHEPRRITTGRFTRAAVFAGASLATAACGGKTKGPEQEIQNASIDAGVDEAPAPDAAQPVEPVDPIEPIEPMDMPYGAPPMRVRIV